MKPYLNVIHFWVLMAVLGASARAMAEEPYNFYPFKVTIGGNEAKLEKKGDLFAVIEKPVKANATIKIEKQVEMLIANVAPCKEDGTVLGGNNIIAIFATNTDSLKLDQSLKKTALKPGTYLMNLVAHGTTSRVVFQVADPAGKIKFPKLGDIVKFLKGES